MMPLPQRSALLPIAISNLLPLVFAAQGWLATPDLLFAYFLEMVTWLLIAASVGANWRLLGAACLEEPRLIFGVILVPIALAGGGLLIAEQVTWDLLSIISIVGVAGSCLITLWFTVRKRDGGRPRSHLGSLAWRVLLFVVGGVLGLSASQQYQELVAHGWEPARLQSEPFLLVVQRLAQWAVDSNLSADLIPIIFIVAVRTLNEVGLELYRTVRDADQADSPRVPA